MLHARHDVEKSAFAELRRELGGRELLWDRRAVVVSKLLHVLDLVGFVHF